RVAAVSTAMASPVGVFAPVNLSPTRIELKGGWPKPHPFHNRVPAEELGGGHPFFAGGLEFEHVDRMPNAGANPQELAVGWSDRSRDTGPIIGLPEPGELAGPVDDDPNRVLP